jgi:glycosyltransferase involved in cell wall biosynthesis
MAPDISVIIATYNRAQDLARTLEGMARAENGGFVVEFVVVDNGSTDQTKLVVDSFSERIPIRYFFEARSGKNRALNTALENCDLGEIVVFTDDDVDVSPDWLVSIRAVCDRWPNHAVFGGRINVVFPDEKAPQWTSDPYLYSLGFAHHYISDSERVYSKFVTPFGPNFWVRRDVFDNGRRFNEAVGPRPTNRIMGSETSFLIALQKDGYETVHSPMAIVSHRVQPDMIRLSTLFRRAYREGRGQAHIFGLPRLPLLRKNPAAWRIHRTGSIVFYTFKVFVALILSSTEKRPRNVVDSMRDLGYRIEAMRLAEQASAALREPS